MNFNIYYLLMAVTISFSAGCALGLCIRSRPFRFGMVRVATLAMAVGGYLAILLFLAREADYGDHGGAYSLVFSAIIALPFLILCMTSMLAPTRRCKVSVLLVTTLFSVAGTSLYYYVSEIQNDESASLVLLFVVPIEFVVALIQLGVVIINRKKLANEATTPA